jgi:hypothetical protein
MPRSSSGRWVARAGATGGGRTYRGQVPINWYAALVLIVIVGIGSIVFARYEYQNPKSAAASTTEPTKGTTWFAAMDFDVCGTQQSALVSDEVDPTKQSFFSTGNGVIVIRPTTTSNAGNHAVLGRFLAGYKGLEVTATEMKLPTADLHKSSSSPTSTTTTTTTTPKKAKSSKTPSKLYRNGETCPPGSPDAGKKAVVEAAYWKNAFASKGKGSVVRGSPSTLKFENDQLITIGFVPSGTTLPKPNGTIVTALLDESTGASSTTTTTTAGASSTTSTSTTSTSTTASSSTTSSTTSSSTTSTTAPSTTSTTSSKS